MATPSNFQFSKVKTPVDPDVVLLIEALQNRQTREEALLRLSKNKAIRYDLAPVLWHSFGTIAIVVQEIIDAYRLLSTPQLTEKASNRICNALVLLQGVAAHPDTMALFIKAKIPLLLHPLLNNSNMDKSHDHIRLSSLGVIGALVKTDNEEAMQFILKTETFPCFLHCMEIGSELTNTVATFILNKVLSTDGGLNYCCVLAERFFKIGRALGIVFEKLVESGKLAEESSKRLLKHIIWCYYRLSQRARPCDGFRLCLPAKLSDSCVITAIRDDPQTIEKYIQLNRNVTAGFISTAQRDGLKTYSVSLLPRLIRS